jgi:phospholipid transport system transporter-binding protein
VKDSTDASATFEVLEGARASAMGTLEFATVSRMLLQGSTAITNGQASIIDLAGITGSDSAGLALLIEWLSVAKEAGHPLRYENIPGQLHQLARLSEVDGLLGST